jgi:hypothetical protein
MSVGAEIQNVIILSKFHLLFFVFSFFCSAQQVRLGIAVSDSASETSELDSLILGESQPV